MCLIDEMNEKAIHEKFNNQFAIQIGKDLLEESFVASLSSASLTILLPLHSKKRERNPWLSVVWLFKYPLEPHCQ